MGLPHSPTTRAVKRPVRTKTNILCTCCINYLLFYKKWVVVGSGCDHHFTIINLLLRHTRAKLYGVEA
jgi:hypothetical protein